MSRFPANPRAQISMLGRSRRLSEKALKALDASVDQNKLSEDIEEQRQVNQRVSLFMNSLDPGTRSQLSRTQLVKSCEKTFDWLKENQGFVQPEPVASSLLEEDVDPGRLADPTYKHIKQSASARKYASIRDVPLERKRLTGSMYEKGMKSEADEKGFATDASSFGVPAPRLQEWLSRRQAHLSEKERLKKFVRSWGKDADLREVVTMWQQKRRELTVDQWIEVYNKKDTKDLSLNEIVKEFREQITYNHVPDGYSATHKAIASSPVTGSTRVSASNAAVNHSNPQSPNPPRNGAFSPFRGGGGARHGTFVYDSSRRH